MRSYLQRRPAGASRLVWLTLMGLSLLLAGAAPALARADQPDIPPLPGGRESPLRFMVPLDDDLLSGPGALSLTARFPSLVPELSFAPGPRMPLSLGQAGAQAGPVSPFRTLAILVDFSDNVHQTGSAGFFDNLLFGTTGATLRSYYREVSYGQLDIVTLNLPGALGWQRALQTYAYYVDGQNCFGTWPQNCQKLAEDVVAMVDPLVDFSQYDNNGDGWVDTVFIIHAGPGAEFTGSDNQIWSHSWWTHDYPQVDGVRVGSYTSEPELWQTPGDMTHGVYAHEVGHAFGLPDLYDYGYDSQGTGRWSLMSAGSWNGSLGNSPAHLDAWSRLYLEFTTATTATYYNQTISLPNVEQNASGAIYRLNTGISGEYFLLENRQKLGSDAALPGAGLLIWHIDENMGSNNYQCLSVNNWLCGSHYHVALEQADSLLDLEYNRSSGDAGDPFPGLTGSTAFAFTTNPNTSSYYGNVPPGFMLSAISPSASTMTAQLSPQGLPAPFALTTPADTGLVTSINPVLRWQESLGAETYKVVVKKPNGNTIFKQTYTAASVCSGGACSVTVATALKDGKTYTWKVVAKNTYGKTKSPIWSFTVNLP